MAVAKDIFDNEIKIGDVVAYSVTVGQTSRMRIGKVLKVLDDKVTASGWSRYQNMVRTDRVNKYGRYDLVHDGTYNWTNTKGTVSYAHAKVLKLDPGSLDPQLKQLMEQENG